MATIRDHVIFRQPMGSCNLPRSTLRYWWGNLTRRTIAFLDNSWDRGFLAAFDHLAALGMTPVSRIR
jgi:hypothetical protein